MKYKIVIVTPAGRKIYLEKLFSHLELQKNDFDEWHLWENTIVNDDLMYIKQLENTYSWIKVINRDDKMKEIIKSSTDEKSIYWRIGKKCKKGSTVAISTFFDFVLIKIRYIFD